MMKTNHYILTVLLFLLLPSCKMSESEKLEKLLWKWNGKEIVFPQSPSFTIYGETEDDFRIPTDGYKIVHYLDSIGCISCKLNLGKWMEYIAYMDSVTNGTVPCLFFIHATQKREVKISMKEDKFDYPGKDFIQGRPSRTVQQDGGYLLQHGRIALRGEGYGRGQKVKPDINRLLNN